nr:DNA/RNA non-specific endonuclease [Lachnoclostridium sp. An76]
MKKSVIRMFDKKYRVWTAGAVLCLSAALTACGAADGTWTGTAGVPDPAVQAESADTIAEVPEYDGVPYVEINDNEPEFTEAELTTESYEEYSELDPLGRCGTAEACIGEDLMPDGEREDISEVEPTGWENREYDIVDGGYVYNRCHLIGFQLSGENANEENLITGTRYMNTEGMLPFENMVAEYVQETDNHVMYRVTPVFEGDDLVASGVQMEAESVEDGGAGICFNIYVYNVQPEIIIDYSTGANWADTDSGNEKTADISAADDSDAENGEDQEPKEQTYILNKNTKKFHKPECSSVDDIKAENKSGFTGTREELIEDGFDPCGKCRP